MAGQRFTPETIRRIASAVRAIEQRPLKNTIVGSQDLAGTFHNWQFIRITSGVPTGGIAGCTNTTEGLAPIQYYPGLISNYNQDTENWEDTTLTVWCRPFSGVTLATGDFVLGRQTKSSGCILGESRPVFAAFKGGGSQCNGLIPVITGVCISQDNNVNHTPVTVTALSMTLNDRNVPIDATSNNVALTVPDPATVTSHEFTIVRNDNSSHDATISPFASESFVGSLNDDTGIVSRSSIKVKYGDAITLFKNSDGNWQIKSVLRGQPKVSQILVSHVVDAGNTGSTDTDLYTDTIVGGTLQDGDRLSFQYAGKIIGSGTDTRTIRFIFAGGTLYTSGALTVTVNSDFELNVMIVRIDATTIRYNIKLQIGGSVYLSVNQTTVFSLNSNQTAVLAGLSAGAGAANNDIVAKAGYIEKKYAA